MNIIKKKMLTTVLLCSSNPNFSLYVVGGAIVVMLLQFLSIMGYTWKWRYWGKIAVKNNFWKKHDE